MKKEIWKEYLSIDEKKHWALKNFETYYEIGVKENNEEMKATAAKDLFEFLNKKEA